MHQLRRYPVRFARASLKHRILGRDERRVRRYPVRFARASLKPAGCSPIFGNKKRYPVRFARASLKPRDVDGITLLQVLLSRAFCAGLIEALAALTHPLVEAAGYPVRFARASLKPSIGGLCLKWSLQVIPCVLRGPH